jgi:hypothetical protein
MNQAADGSAGTAAPDPDAEVIAECIREVLLDPQIPLRRLD